MAVQPSDQVYKMYQNYAITGFHTHRADDPVPVLRGFVRSPFNPLIYHSALKAAEAAGLSRDAEPAAERRGILLGSLFVDAVTEEETWSDLLHGKKLSPIMFPQSVPSAVIGFTARELGIRGPMSCMGAERNTLSLLLQQATDWIDDDEADAVIVVSCDVPSRRLEHWMRAHALPNESFIGGAISFVVESKALAEVRGRTPVMSIPDLLQLTAPGDMTMIGGDADVAPREALR